MRGDIVGYASNHLTAAAEETAIPIVGSVLVCVFSQGNLLTFASFPPMKTIHISAAIIRGKMHLWHPEISSKSPAALIFKSREKVFIDICWFFGIVDSRSIS